ncbi:methylenetetrahydrofolate reductase-domain-containing protein [Jimgerdemannia flammicorona]|uniref:Methylenetetrahydrofolate reductase-domain-containing protein n=1 Tax=Jimgerdemannia flammicorona TaxID=994334 RepID=A0A433QQU2_9FUNG|nr:methylenetetrahydrofolate reductase-domain-containing protein [Jimgerdemannia flammicorona]
MKVIDKINKAIKENQPCWSFEFFPPKTPQGVQNLYDRMERMYGMGPEFIDITWNAGGVTSDLTAEIVTTAQSVYGLETMMHLTCTNMPKEKIDIALREAKACGCRNILALRGDPPRGQTEWQACDNGFEHAIDLIKYIKEQYGDWFGIAVAGHPEGHVDNRDLEEDILFLKEKVDAGADLIITQLFMDTDIFLQFVDRARRVGITVPILPAMFAIQSYNFLKRVTSFDNNHVPQQIWDDLEPIKHDDEAVKAYGVDLSVRMVRELYAKGFRAFHFLTFNLAKSTRLTLEKLGWVPSLEMVKPLPWKPETVRPIFWKNRTHSYVQRTENWDEYPNGRWGDARSPAFGEIDGYGVTLNFTPEECLTMWSRPTTISEICSLFARYCMGELKALPWSAQQLELESDSIRQRLTEVNLAGYLTINSQPAVNGARSTNPVYGWGPVNGYVYQKAYLEFFVPKEMLTALEEKIAKDGDITYFAVNIKGDLKSNSGKEKSPTAVTWGVFPGKEIVQPTIVEEDSFMAWKVWFRRPIRFAVMVTT